MSRIKIKLNWYDKTIGYFSPETLVKRTKAKIHNEYLQRKYEGSDKGRRTDGWNTGGKEF